MGRVARRSGGIAGRIRRRRRQLRRHEPVHIAAIGTNGAIGDAIRELDIEERRKRRVELDAVLPEFAMATNLAVEREIAHGDRTVLALESRRAVEELAESKHG